MNSTKRTLSAAALAATCALALGACGSNASTSQSSSAAAPAASGSNGNGNSNANGNGGNGWGGQGRRPGTRGLVAAVTGTTMQVQSQTAQTAVSWSSSTKILATTPGTTKDVAVGSCVMARLPQSGTTATSVSVSAPVGGACTGLGGGFGGMGGYRGNRGGGAPSGNATPSQNHTRGAGFGSMVIGTVSSIDGTTVHVTPVKRPNATASATAAPTSFQLGGSTKVTTTKAASASAIKVGECATAMGKADSTGAVAATSITVSPATNGSCSQGRGFGGGQSGNGSTGGAA